MIERTHGFWVTVGADIAPLRRELIEASRLGDRFGSSLTRAFEQATLRGRDLGEVLRGLALDLSRAVLQAALNPFTRLIGGGLAQLFTGALRGVPVPFAHGGVIASPVAFPLGSARTGIAGEAGAEAILPLARGSDGRLGVRAEGMAASITVNFHVSAPDADSFRRSEGQITAMLNRAVSRGARNL